MLYLYICSTDGNSYGTYPVPGTSVALSKTAVISSMMKVDQFLLLFALCAPCLQANAAPIIPSAGLISFWDFQEPTGPFVAKQGRGRYILEEASWNAKQRVWSSNNLVERVRDTPLARPFGPMSAFIAPGQMLHVLDTYNAAPLLNIHGDNATLSVVAWVRPAASMDNTTKGFGHVAGIWSEPISVRTYVMFCPQSGRGRLDHPGNHIDAEVSRTGATMQPACRWSVSYALGATPINSSSWHMLAMTFDGDSIRAFVNGSLDYRPPYRLNPPSSLCNETWQNPASISTWTNRSRGRWGPGGAPGAPNNRTNFAVGGQRAQPCADGVKCDSGLGHQWTGYIGGLAVFDRALLDTELVQMALRTGMAPLPAPGTAR